MTRILIRGGRLIDPITKTDRIADLAIDGNVFAGIDVDGFSPDQVINAHNRWVLPGLVDLATRLREPGEEQKADIASECRAAAAAGITTLCAYPDTQPTVDTPADIRLIRQKACAVQASRVEILGALTQNLDGRRLTEMAALQEAGCVGLSNARFPLENSLILRRALEYASGLGITVHVQPLDASLSQGGCVHEGAIATRTGLPGIPIAAETAAMGQWLALIEETEARVHFGRLSSARGAALIQRALENGLPVSADVAIHQLFLTENDAVDFNPNTHVLPPFRTETDRAALRQAVKNGTIGAICSDHQPHEPDAKLAPFADTEPGISALDTLLGLMLRLIEEDCLTPLQAVERFCTNPAHILGLPVSGFSTGFRADFIILDPQAEWEVDPRHFGSRGHHSPFTGWLLRGKVHHTFIEGQPVVDEDSSI